MILSLQPFNFYMQLFPISWKTSKILETRRYSAPKRGDTQYCYKVFRAKVFESTIPSRKAKKYIGKPSKRKFHGTNGKHRNLRNNKKSCRFESPRPPRIVIHLRWRRTAPRRGSSPAEMTRTEQNLRTPGGYDIFKDRFLGSRNKGRRL